MLDFFKNRLKEASTWRGIVAIATAFGLVLSPEQKEAIIAGGLALMGLIGAFTPDSKKVETVPMSTDDAPKMG